MKIYHFNLAKDFGGGEIQTLNLLRWLDVRGKDQVVVVKKGGLFAQRVAEEFPDIRQMGVVDSFFNLATRGRLSCCNLILHSHDGRSLHICSLLKIFFRVPVLSTRRVDKGLPTRKLSQISYRNADRLVAVSQRIQDRLEAGLGPKACIRIPDSYSGFATDENVVGKIRKRFAGKKLIGQIGSLYDIKGHEYTIEVARSLAIERPELHFVFLGEGDARNRLEKMAEGLDNLTFVGFVEDVGNWLAALDLLVHPSLREGLGSILLEAQQFGVPVIASDVGGIPDVVIGGETGLLIPPRDVQALKGAILRLVDDQDLSAQLVAGAKVHLVNFTPDAVGQAYLDLYQELLAES